MIFHRYPHPEQIPMEADRWSYITHAKRSHISVVEVAHLAHGIIAKMDNPLVFLNPTLFKVNELYALLIDAAQTGKVQNTINEKGNFKAPLIDWCSFLCSIKYPIPTLFLQVACEELDLRDKLKEQASNETSSELIKTNTKSNRERLEEEILRISKHFPSISRKYYAIHPDIAPLRSLSMTEGAFEDLVTKISKKSNLPQRKRGCPRKDFLDP